MKVESDLLNIVTRADSKNATGVDTPKFARKFDLAISKSDVDKLDIDELKIVPRNSNNMEN